MLQSIRLIWHQTDTNNPFENKFKKSELNVDFVVMQTF